MRLTLSREICSCCLYLCHILTLPPTHSEKKDCFTMPKRGRRRKKTRTHADAENVAGTLGPNADVVKVPKSLVVRFFVCVSSPP